MKKLYIQIKKFFSKYTKQKKFKQEYESFQNRNSDELKEFMKVFNWDHSCSESINAMGLSPKNVSGLSFDAYCRDILFFAYYSNYFLAKRIFDKFEDAPENLRSLSSALERALKLCKNVKEAVYIISIHRDFLNICINSLGMYIAFHDENEESYSKEDRREVKEIIEESRKNFVKHMKKRINEEKKERTNANIRGIVPTHLFFDKSDVVKENFNDYSKFRQASKKMDNDLYELFE